MTGAPHRDPIEERLRAVPGGEPPADLLDRIRDEIPEPLAGDPAVEPPAEPGRGVRRRLLAAALVVAVGGGLLAYRVARRVGPPPAAPPAAVTEVESRADERAPETLEALGDLGGSDPEPAAASDEARPEPPATRPEGAIEDAVAGDPGAGPGADDARRRLSAAKPPARVEQTPAAPATAAPPPASEAYRAGSPRIEQEPSEVRQQTLARDRRQRLDELRDAPLRSLAGEPDAAAGQPSPQAGRTALAGPGAAPAPPPPPPPVEPRKVEARRSMPAPPPSTGGSAEPNDQPYGDTFFRSYGVNPFVDTEDDPLSTFGLEVDTGSYTVTRSYLDRGHLPPPEAVRVEEFVNFFDYGDAAPAEGDFAIAVDGAPSPFAPGPRYHLVRIGIRARDVARAERPPADLLFVVDVSGSMRRGDRLGLVRESLLLLLDQLAAGDRVGLVSYGDRARLELEPTSDLEAVRRAVRRLAPGGSTNAEEGLLLGYEVAARQRREGALTRVVLCSDGVANVGRTGPGSILERVAAGAAAGIELTTVGFGMGNYNDVLMEQLADRGDGRYAYVDSPHEARRLFVEELTGTLLTVARDAKAQVAFDPEVVSRYRLLGYENRDVPDEQFRVDTVDAGEIGAGHRVTALYEVKLHERPRRGRPLATVSLRYHSAAANEVVEIERPIRRSALAPSWEGASRGLRLAAVAAELAELLRHSYWARDTDPEALFRRAQQVAAEFPGDPAVTELASLVAKAARLGAGRSATVDE